MKSSNLAESFTERRDARSELGVYGFAVGVAAVGATALLVLSAAFSIGDDGSDVAGFVGCSGVTGVVAYALARRPVSPQSLKPVSALPAAVVAYLVLAAISTVVYLVTGAFDRLDEAAYESIVGVSTNSLTILEDPSVLGDGVLIWRAGTQWLGGMAALALGVGLLPFLGGSAELADVRNRSRSGFAMAPRPTPALRRVAVIYSIASIGVFVAFIVVGMGPRDAVAHTFSSVSTGGFSTHADSIAHFDSVAVELAVILAMAGAGSSAAIVWMLYRRQFEATRRVYEVRVYAAALVTATLWVWWLNRDIDAGAARGLRESLFTVVSLVTTTGHRIGDWGDWHPGAVTLLLVLIAIGGMAGSVAGGLRWIRVIGLVEFVWRELQRQLHPRSVRSVKVGSATISEDSVDRMHAQLMYTMAVGTIGAVGLAFEGTSILEALSLAISAVATAGPGVNEAGETLTNAAGLTRLERLTLMPIMLAGRVALYPAFVLLGASYFGLGRVISRRVRAFGARK